LAVIAEALTSVRFAPAMPTFAVWLGNNFSPNPLIRENTCPGVPRACPQCAKTNSIGIRFSSWRRTSMSKRGQFRLFAAPIKNVTEQLFATAIVFGDLVRHHHQGHGQIYTACIRFFDV
jgi:hypothetical protein